MAKHLIVLAALLPCVRVQVESRFGSVALRECFVLTKRFSPDSQALLDQLQLPILDLPLPPAASLTFLERLGVSTEPNLPTLLKALQHLSAAAQLGGSDS